MPQVNSNVVLVKYTPDPEQLISSAAKLCYAEDTKDILQQDDDKSKKFVKILKNMCHFSPIEHANFTFYIEGISRACSHQLVRHRIASYSQRSQRYVGHDDFDYIVPPNLVGKTIITVMPPDWYAGSNTDIKCKKIDAVEYFKDTMHIISERYKILNDALGNNGEKSNEDARYVLPNACETKIFVTMNARSLLHFFEERLCNRAQWEIREVAEKMLTLVKEIVPSIFEDAGPKCICHEKCPEGKMTCGKIKEMKEKYLTK